MQILDAIYARRSIKRFETSKQMSPDEEQILLEATIQAPTSFNVQHWRLIILRDLELRQKIYDNYCPQPQVIQASLLVLFTADMKAWEKDPSRYWKHAPQDVQDDVINAIGPFHETLGDQFQREEAQRSIGMAMQTLMLAAQELGYQSCPMIGFDLEGLIQTVKLPKDHVIGPMVAIGKGTKDAWPKSNQLSLKEIVFENTF